MRLQSRSFARWNPRLTEIAQVHGCFSSQSFWKAGSPRKGSHCGWSLRSAGVRQLLYGISKRRCSLGIARFLSPTKTSTNAKFSSTLGPSTASFTAWQQRDRTLSFFYRCILLAEHSMNYAKALAQNSGYQGPSGRAFLADAAFVEQWLSPRQYRRHIPGRGPERMD